VSSTVEGLERGVVGTQATLEKMHKLVALGKLDPTFQKIATWIRLSVPTDRRGATKETADAVFRWCSDHGVFQRDPFQIEKIEHPIEAMRPIIQARAAGTYKGKGLFVGDCDTFAIVTATLLGVLGFQYAFEVAKVDADRPDEFSHVWTSALVEPDHQWYSLDSSTKGAYPGWKPPVAANLLARFPEHPIETVVKGADMSSWNSSNGGLGDDDRNDSPMKGVDAEYAEDYIGYGIPKDFGDGPGIIPDANFDQLQLLPPNDTQIPSADLQPDMHILKAAPGLEPAERIRKIFGQPDDHGNPYYRGAGRQPYYKVNDQPYPPGSPWNGDIGVDSVRYVRTNQYIKKFSPETPEMKVEVQMGQPMLIRRRSVMATPRQIPYGSMSGMGDEDMPNPTPPPDTSTWDDSSFVGSLTTPTPTVKAAAPATTPQQASAQAAGSSVWDSISAAFKAVGTVAPAAMQSSLAKSVVNATNKLAGKPVVAVGVTSWYTNPFVIGGTLLALGGAAFVFMKSRPGIGSRRRR
jgi:hypothetical protein